MYLKSLDKEMILRRNVTDAHAQGVVANKTCYYPPRMHLNSSTTTTRYAKCLMFSVCVQKQNRLSRPPIAVIYSPATRQTRPVPSGDHLFCHRPAEPVMAGFEIGSQIYIYSEDGSTFLRQTCTYSPSYTSSHPGRNIHASAFSSLRRTPLLIHDGRFLIIYGPTPIQGEVSTVSTFSRLTIFF
jgi:hypothetical protein